jgi:uncharacterized protein (UPF0254 family)
MDLTAVLGKVEAMEKQLQLHQQLPDQVAFKGFKEYQEISDQEVNKVCAVKLAQLVNKELRDQLARKDLLA